MSPAPIAEADASVAIKSDGAGVDEEDRDEEEKNDEGNKALPIVLSGELSLKADASPVSPSLSANLASSLLLRYCTAACKETRLNLHRSRTR